MNKYLPATILLVVAVLSINNSVRLKKENNQLSQLLKVKTETDSSHSFEEALDPLVNGKLIPGLEVVSTHKYRNVQIFLLSSTTGLDHVKYTTLVNSFKEGGIKVHETSDVNNLAISNLSDQTVFINYSEILRGGKQDRTVQYDMVIPPKVKRWRMPGFCVEQNRWEQREEEAEDVFVPTRSMLSSSALKEAAADGDQGAVWANAEAAMDSISSNAFHKEGHYSYNTTKSYHVTLNDTKLTSLAESYSGDLRSLGIKPDQSNGLAVAVNGVLVSVDIYNNRKLFQDLFEQLLNSAVNDALGRKQLENVKVLNHSDVYQVINNVDEEHSKKRSVNKRTMVSSNSSSEYLCMTSIDLLYMQWIHKSWVRKSDNKVRAYQSMED